jgi:hypothetical protein
MHLNSRLEGHWRRKGIREITVFNSSSVAEKHSASKMAEEEGSRLLCSSQYFTTEIHCATSHTTLILLLFLLLPQSEVTAVTADVQRP